MQEDSNTIEKLSDDLKTYVNTQVELVTLKAAQKTADVGSNLVSIIILLFVGSMFLLFINFALAFYLSTLLNNQHAGFFIVAGFYLFLTLIFILFRKKLITIPVRNSIIKQFLGNE